MKRRAWLAGVAGPVGFVGTSLLIAALRQDVIRAEGWASWPSSMALGGPPAATPQIAAFLWLGSSYLVFAVWSLHPVLHDRITTVGFLGAAAGDLLLAFPTDARGVPPSWHGTLHLVGVLLATTATLVAAGGSMFFTRDRPAWGPWRMAGPVLFLAAFIGLVAGFDRGWAKAAYVLGITLPVVVLARCVARDTPPWWGRDAVPPT